MNLEPSSASLESFKKSVVCPKSNFLNQIELKAISIKRRILSNLLPQTVIILLVIAVAS